MSTSTARPLISLIAALLFASVSVAAQFPEKGPIARGPVTRTLRAYIPPVGPAPQNIGFDASGTYGVIAKVVWSPAPNAVSYVVTRWLLEDPACCNATSGPLTTTTWTDTGLLKKGTYMFAISVNYADGSIGTGQVGVIAGDVRNPSPITAQDLGPGRVRLTWNNAIPGTSGAMISGPGFPTPKVGSGGYVDTPFLPPGTHTWTVASIYSGGLGVLGPGEPVTHTVSYGMGRYRVSLERFKAINVTAEDPFRNDGRGDEIFITTQVSEYGANGSLVSTRMARTPTFGDVQNFPARVRAGSASPTGGIQPNDEYPAAAQYISQLQPATISNLPYLLWEGDLSEIKGAVILSPAIWESDEDDRLFPYFLTFQTGAAANVVGRSPFQAYVPWTLGSPGSVLDSWNPQKSCPPPSQGSAAGRFFPSINGWRDEPIDMDQDRSYCPTYVAINWRLANSMTTVNPASVVEIPFTNGATNWQYKLYLRIEKVIR